MQKIWRIKKEEVVSGVSEKGAVIDAETVGLGEVENEKGWKEEAEATSGNGRGNIEGEEKAG